MELNLKICSQARKTRDARFDGHFFIAVLTTHIYCRPVCPSLAANEENVRYFRTAAAAAKAGFRPCLRCRPECSPGIPIRVGKSAVVARALRMMAEGPLDDEYVQALAGRLGVGDRELYRLFLEHTGASSTQVIETRRIHFAKRLLDETSLSMERVAHAAGFGTGARFTTKMRVTYGFRPSHIRMFAHRSEIRPENEFVLPLSYRSPLEWDRMLAFLSLRAIPGVELVEGSRYRRTISLGGLSGSIEASLSAGESAVKLHISFAEPRWLPPIMERVRSMFDLNADPFEIASQLSADPLMQPHVSAAPGLRVPGCWDGYELAVRAILGQQVTVKGASTLAGRLVKEFGTAVDLGGGLTHLFPAAEVVAQADLTRIGLTAARAKTIRGLASAVSDGRIVFTGIVDIADFLLQIQKLPGIGDWTAQYIAMRALGAPDAFPSGDLGLLKAAGVARPREMEERSQAWRPWRAYAAMHLWNSLGCT